MTKKLKIAIIGSTGSIGQSTLRVAEWYPDRIEVVGLAAGSNVALLAKQARQWHPRVVCVADTAGADKLLALLGDLPCEVLTGLDGVNHVAALEEANTTVIAAVGAAGIRPTLAAISAGKRVALANKETLVAAGSIVMPFARGRGIEIAPIDSEHSAIWQCLRAGRPDEVERLILTASGGPFRTRPLDTSADITPEEALAHPTWNMGPRITIDSATMMNKGFEIIEAAWLFGLTPDRVDVVIHPESIIHSMVEFCDGSVVAQMGVPDMTLPITYALLGPERANAAEATPRYNPAESPALHFEAPDPNRYPALDLARHAWMAGPTGGAVINAADEIAVEAFLAGLIPFPAIVELVGEVLGEHDVVTGADIDDIEAADSWARQRVRMKLGQAGLVEETTGAPGSKPGK